MEVAESSETRNCSPVDMSCMSCIGVRCFNMLPFYIKAEVDNPKKFKAVLQKYLRENSIYSLDEYFELHS